MAIIELSTVVPSPAARVFDLSIDVDAHTASMLTARERVVAGVAHGPMALGDTVTWAARHFGVTWRMTSRITVHDRPHRFVDEQVSGPFRRWYHEHLFTDEPDDGTDGAPGSTVMVDRIEFTAPAGPLGWVVTIVFLRRYMRRLIDQRNTHLVRALAAAAPDGPGTASKG
ncbi:SRPBCC family protein [Micromonospora sp. NPDC049523]|uniref:SRPBCC family protein n=1 Tax=Micromonospora sp. NPDC049523 TaxID=3155921 RepID=UPI00342E9774